MHPLGAAAHRNLPVQLLNSKGSTLINKIVLYESIISYPRNTTRFSLEDRGHGRHTGGHRPFGIRYNDWISRIQLHTPFAWKSTPKYTPFPLRQTYQMEKYCICFLQKRFDKTMRSRTIGWRIPSKRTWMEFPNDTLKQSATFHPSWREGWQAWLVIAFCQTKTNFVLTVWMYKRHNNSVSESTIPKCYSSRTKMQNLALSWYIFPSTMSRTRRLASLVRPASIHENEQNHELTIWQLIPCQPALLRNAGLPGQQNTIPGEQLTLYELNQWSQKNSPNSPPGSRVCTLPTLPVQRSALFMHNSVQNRDNISREVPFFASRFQQYSMNWSEILWYVVKRNSPSNDAHRDARVSWGTFSRSVTEFGKTSGRKDKECGHMGVNRMHGTWDERTQ